MNRYSVPAALVLLALVVPVRAGAPAPLPSPIERALRVPIVVIGKVTSIEKETVEAVPFIGGGKVVHKVAVVKIESHLAGAAGLTHIKIGFVPPVKFDPKAPRPTRPPTATPQLAEGKEMLLFLSPHADAGFHLMPWFAPPLDVSEGEYKANIEGIKKALATVADPLPALKAEKAEDRLQAALALIMHYRLQPPGTSKVNTVVLDAEENRLILHALAGADWKYDTKQVRLNAMTVYYQLGLTEAEGWKPPPLKKGEEYTETMRIAFAAWLAGPGKDYRIKKYVPKK